MSTFFVLVGTVVACLAGGDWFVALVGVVIIVLGLVLPFLPVVDPDVDRGHLEPRHLFGRPASRRLANELIYGRTRPADDARVDRAVEDVDRRDDGVLPALWDGDGRPRPERPD